MKRLCRVVITAALGAAPTIAHARAQPDAVASDPVASDPDPAPAPARPRFPRLVLAGGPLLGPHALGNEECRSEAQRCQQRGAFLGLGAQLELRARLYKALYAHARGFVTGNVSSHDRIYRGIGGGAVGLGGYGRRMFTRVEIIPLGAWGENRFTPPFHAEPTGRDTWGNLAGSLTAGFRQPIKQRLSLELWGGFMLGPSSVRTVPSVEPDRRVLPTFLLGLNLAVDVLP